MVFIGRVDMRKRESIAVTYNMHASDSSSAKRKETYDSSCTNNTCGSPSAKECMIADRKHV